MRFGRESLIRRHKVAFVTKTGCIIKSEGHVNRCKDLYRATYTLVHGSIPDNTPFICHRCDNGACFNPAHLFAGTSKDNLRDMSKKGRQALQAHPENAPRGLRNGVAIKPDIDKIFELRKLGYSAQDIADQLKNGSSRVIYKVLKGKHWSQR